MSTHTNRKLTVDELKALALVWVAGGGAEQRTVRVDDLMAAVRDYKVTGRQSKKQKVDWKRGVDSRVDETVKNLKNLCRKGLVSYQMSGRRGDECRVRDTAAALNNLDR